MSILHESQHLKIPFSEIIVATENFKTFIGQGGYGLVFKGKLLVSGKETMVAVKRLNEQFGQGLKEFLTEIQLLSGQKHPNLISLVGYCDEGREKSIVYEYAERGSLDLYIRRTRKTTSTTLTWLQRLKICVDVARGLNYLHSHVRKHQTIIHRDIKSSNILIDENWVGKISDLGLSKLSVTGFGMSEIVSNACGTRGYCDPESINSGIVTKKADVFSFGVVLFEVLCGRLCIIDKDDGFSLTAMSAKEYYKNKTLDKIIDQSLREHVGSYSMNKFSEIANGCLHHDRNQRPAMDVVVKELEEALKYQEEYEFEGERRLKRSVVQEDDTDEYWETKLPSDMDSLIKIFKIPEAVCTSKNELFSFLHKGTLFDEGNKFFWINDDGKKCLSISAKRFLFDLYVYGGYWIRNYDNRFKVVARCAGKLHDVKFQIKTSMLSLGTMYEASLVMKSHAAEPTSLFTIKWKTNDLIVCSTHAAQRKTDAWARFKIWKFWNHVPNAEFDIVIDEFIFFGKGQLDDNWIQGIEFQPVQMHKGLISPLDDDDDDDIDDNEYWEKKLPKNYQHYIEMSDKPLEYATKKELYLIFCHGFLADKGKQWFSVSKPTRGICSVLPANFSPRYNSQATSETLSLPESRFGLVKILGDDNYFLSYIKLESVMFSPEYTYACYLLFKFRDNSSVPDNDILFKTKCELGTMGSYRSMYPVNIPTIKPKNDYGLHDSSNILKAEGHAMKKDRTEDLGYTRIEERKDGWMEAMLFKLTNKLEDQRNNCHIQIELASRGGSVNGMFVEGIEFRPYL